MVWSSATFYCSCVDGIVAKMSIKESEGLKSSSQKALKALRAELESRSAFSGSPSQALRNLFKRPCFGVWCLTDRCSGASEHPASSRSTLEKAAYLETTRGNSTESKSYLCSQNTIPEGNPKDNEREFEGKSKRETDFKGNSYVTNRESKGFRRKFPPNIRGKKNSRETVSRYICPRPASRSPTELSAESQ